MESIIFELAAKLCIEKYHGLNLFAELFIISCTKVTYELVSDY